MILLDENIGDDQRHRLGTWGIRCRQVGIDVGRAGMTDENIVPLLISLPRPTLITRDSDFGQARLRHARYGIVYLEVGPSETAVYARRTLRHPEFNTTAKRLGLVARVSQAGIRAWRRHGESEWLA